MALADQVGSKVKELRERRGMTQSSLAEASSMTSDEVSRIERARARAALRHARAARGGTPRRGQRAFTGNGRGYATHDLRPSYEVRGSSDGLSPEAARVAEQCARAVSRILSTYLRSRPARRSAAKKRRGFRRHEAGATLRPGAPLLRPGATVRRRSLHLRRDNRILLGGAPWKVRPPAPKRWRRFPARSLTRARRDDGSAGLVRRHQVCRWVVQSWLASVSAPQWTGKSSLPRTIASARTACSGPMCQSRQARLYCPTSISARSKGPNRSPISPRPEKRPLSPEKGSGAMAPRAHNRSRAWRRGRTAPPRRVPGGRRRRRRPRGRRHVRQSRLR